MRKSFRWPGEVRRVRQSSVLGRLDTHAGGAARFLSSSELWCARCAAVCVVHTRIVVAHMLLGVGADTCVNAGFGWDEEEEECGFHSTVDCTLSASGYGAAEKERPMPMPSDGKRIDFAQWQDCHSCVAAGMPSRTPASLSTPQSGGFLSFLQASAGVGSSRSVAGSPAGRASALRRPSQPTRSLMMSARARMCWRLFPARCLTSAHTQTAIPASAQATAGAPSGANAAGLPTKFADRASHMWRLLPPSILTASRVSKAALGGTRTGSYAETSATRTAPRRIPISPASGRANCASRYARTARTHPLAAPGLAVDASSSPSVRCLRRDSGYLCVQDGWGWCPVLQKCGGFANKNCAAVAPKLSEAEIEEHRSMPPL